MVTERQNKNATFLLDYYKNYIYKGFHKILVKNIVNFSSANLKITVSSSTLQIRASVDQSVGRFLIREIALKPGLSVELHDVYCHNASVCAVRLW